MDGPYRRHQQWTGYVGTWHPSPYPHLVIVLGAAIVETTRLQVEKLR